MRFFMLFIKIISAPVFVFALVYWALYVQPERALTYRFHEIKLDFLDHKSIYLRYLIEAHHSTESEPKMSYMLLREQGAAVGSNVFEYLIYDESDELARRPSERTEIWNRTAERRLQGVLDSSCHVSAFHLEGHVYAAISAC